MALRIAKIDAINASIAPIFLALKKVRIPVKDTLVIFLNTTLLKSLLKRKISAKILFIID